MKRLTFVALVLLWGILTATLPAADSGGYRYYSISGSDLNLTEGAWPVVTDENRNAGIYLNRAQRRAVGDAMRPYALLDGKGEAYATASRDETAPRDFNLAIRIPDSNRDKVTGRLYVRKADFTGMNLLRFSADVSEPSTEEARKWFYERKRDHYQNLLSRDIPGAAWFRYQKEKAESVLQGQKPDRSREPIPAQPPRAATSEFRETFNLLSGGRAVSENLQLDRLLNIRPQMETTVPLASLEGITVAEMDWKPLIEGLEPEIDPLASLIPADQHVLFFPSFQSMVDLVDEATKNGTPVLRILEPRSEDARTRERYERQLCIPLDDIARALGPKLVSSVAFTGADPFLRTGSDAAVLFESSDINSLKLLIAARQAAAVSSQGAQPVKGTIADVAYTGVVSKGRTISSYMMVTENAVVVANSTHSIHRIVETKQGKTPALSTLPEYAFFRDRYKRSDKDESALLILSDAAIRRWCSPRWRIAASRRTRVAALMSQLQAERLDATRDDGNVEPATHSAPVLDGGEIEVTADGVASSRYGTLEFLTPIAELAFDCVTKSEADGYSWFRRGYQNNWSRWFDPIAIRFSVGTERIAADVSVMPLIAGTDYREFIQLTGGGHITKDSGDRHPEAFVHYIMSIGKDSEPVREIGNFASRMAPTVKSNPLSWLGDSISIYADEDPFWGELMASYKAETESGERQKVEEFLEDEFHRFPIAIEVDVSNVISLTAFLTAVRLFIDQTAPGLTVWEALTYNDQPYVRITPSKQAIAETEQVEKLAVYYIATGRSLTLTLSETLVKRALDRQAAARAAIAEGKTPTTAGPPWLGKSLGFQAEKSLLTILEALTRESYVAAMQWRSWGALPILNEWRRLFPDQDPVALHERFWQTRLVCPGGGRYVWNDEFQTMESTAYGCPGRPKEGPTAPAPLKRAKSANLGVTFEHGGLRARGEVLREP